MESKTFGEILVGIDFNAIPPFCTIYDPSNDNLVYQIKSKYAEIINMLEEARATTSEHSQYQRYISVAITEAQTAQMWAVKAVTAK